MSSSRWDSGASNEVHVSWSHSDWKSKSYRGRRRLQRYETGFSWFHVKSESDQINVGVEVDGLVCHLKVEKPLFPRDLRRKASYFKKFVIYFLWSDIAVLISKIWGWNCRIFLSYFRIKVKNLANFGLHSRRFLDSLSWKTILNDLDKLCEIFEKSKSIFFDLSLRRAKSKQKKLSKSTRFCNIWQKIFLWIKCDKKNDKMSTEHSNIPQTKYLYIFLYQKDIVIDVKTKSIPIYQTTDSSSQSWNEINTSVATKVR